MSNHGGSAQRTETSKRPRTAASTRPPFAHDLVGCRFGAAANAGPVDMVLAEKSTQSRSPVTAVDDHQERAMHAGLSASAITELPVFEYRKSNGCAKNGTGHECSICLSSIQDGDMVRLLIHCKHLFHRECVDLWLKSSVSCPVCRSNAGGDKPELDEAHSASPSMVEV